MYLDMFWLKQKIYIYRCILIYRKVVQFFKREYFLFCFEFQRYNSIVGYFNFVNYNLDYYWKCFIKVDMRYVRFDLEEVFVFYDFNNLMGFFMLFVICVNLFIGSQRRQEFK